MAPQSPPPGGRFRRHRGGGVSAAEVVAVVMFCAVATVAIARQPGATAACLPVHLTTRREMAGADGWKPGGAAPTPATAAAVDAASVPRSGPRVAAALTTSKRPALFHRAYFSFRARCLDCDALVDAWFAVDDGSSRDELAAMKASTGDIVWLDKPSGERGHVSSLNRVLAATSAYDYLVFLEDDFFFVRDADYVSKALSIMAKNASIGQVVFNKEYTLTNTDAEARDQVGGIDVLDPATGAVDYVLHEYVGPAGSPAWSEYFARHPGFGSVHWPHFSLNSGVWRLHAVRDVGRFEPGEAFEFFYGLRYMARGYVTAFFPGRYSIHLGKPLPGSRIGDDVLDAMYREQGLRHSVNGTASAYDLNHVIR